MPIPKKIHFCWLSDDPLPLAYQNYIKSWQLIMPDYEIIKWDRNRFPPGKSKWVDAACSARKYAFASDYIRFYALVNEGGIYFDADVEVLKRFDDLLSHRSFIGFEYNADLEAAIIGSEPHLDWTTAVLRDFDRRSFVQDDGAYDLTPLPITISRVLEQKGVNIEKIDKGTVNQKGSITFCPFFYFSPKDVHSGVVAASKETYCIHWFDGGWLLKGKLHKLKNFVHVFLKYILQPGLYRNVIIFIRRLL